MEFWHVLCVMNCEWNVNKCSTWLQRRNNIWHSDQTLSLFIKTGKAAIMKEKRRFCVWRPGLWHERCTLTENQKKGPVQWVILTGSDKKIGVDTSLAFASTWVGLNDIDNDWVETGGQPMTSEHNLNKRYLTAQTSNMSDLGSQFDNPDYFLGCAFCVQELETVAALTAHIDETHKGNLFKFDCQLCNFKARGPKSLWEHIAEMHDEGPDANTSTFTTDSRPDNTTIIAHHSIPQSNRAPAPTPGDSSLPRSYRVYRGQQLVRQPWPKQPNIVQALPIHGVDLSSSDDNTSNVDPTQAIKRTKTTRINNSPTDMIRLLPQKAGTLNYLPLNLDNAHRENNNNSSIAAMHSNKSGSKYITNKNVTQIEVITLQKTQFKVCIGFSLYCFFPQLQINWSYSIVIRRESNHGPIIVIQRCALISVSSIAQVFNITIRVQLVQLFQAIVFGKAAENSTFPDF